MPEDPTTGKARRFSARDRSLYLTVGGAVAGCVAGVWIGVAAEGDVVTSVLVFTLLGAVVGYIAANKKRPRPRP